MKRGITLKKSFGIIAIVTLLSMSFNVVTSMKIKAATTPSLYDPLEIKSTFTHGIDISSEGQGNYIDNSALLLEKERISKGYVIGTAGKGVVALRFDDYQNVFGEKIYPMLVARGLPSSMALISRFNTSHKWGIGSTWNQVREWNRNGVEMWSHGTDHLDYSKKGYSGLYNQIVTSKEEIQGQDIKVVGWVLPGVSPTTNNLPYNGLTKPSDYNSVPGKLLMNTYALTEAYAYKPSRTLPMKTYHGGGHITVSDGKETLQSSIKAIDMAIKNKTAIELMCHPGNLGKPGNLTFKEFETLLDYIKIQWDKDLIEVLTPSGVYFADPNTSNRLKLTTDDSFENLKVYVPKEYGLSYGPWKETTCWNGNIIKKTSGRTGKYFCRISGNEPESGISQSILNLDKLGVSGEQFLFEGWFRSPDNESTTGLVQIKDFDNSNRLKIVKKATTSGTSWTRLRFVFCIPPGTKNMILSLYRGTGAVIDWDDVTIKKI